MIVKQIDNGKKGRFFIEMDNDVPSVKTVAEMTYVWVGKERIIIDHTDVDPILKGKGIGKLLVSKVVEFARLKNIKIFPLCPFAKSVFDKTPEFSDVL